MGFNCIRVKYHFSKYPELKKIEILDQGDFIDLRAATTVRMKAGEHKLIPLGISVKLPEGYWAQFVPRSSTFKKYGIIQTNSFAVIDESYCGDEDEWFFPAYATRYTEIPMNERICQFRLVKKTDPIVIEEVDNLSGPNRGGFGSTGRI